MGFTDPDDPLETKKKILEYCLFHHYIILLVIVVFYDAHNILIFKCYIVAISFLNKLINILYWEFRLNVLTDQDIQSKLLL